MAGSSERRDIRQVLSRVYGPNGDPPRVDLQGGLGRSATPAEIQAVIDSGTSYCDETNEDAITMTLEEYRDYVSKHGLPPDRPTGRR